MTLMTGFRWRIDRGTDSDLNWMTSTVFRWMIFWAAESDPKAGGGLATSPPRAGGGRLLRAAVPPCRAGPPETKF